MNPYIVIAALLSCTVMGYKLGVDHEVASQARSEKHIKDAVQAANEASAKAIAEIKPKYTTINNKVQREIETQTVYRDCKLTPDGLQLADQALTGRPAQAASGSKLPAP